jgi:hypothetical protein
MSEFLEIRCGRNRFLVASAEIDSIEVIEGEFAPFAGRRASRALMWLDGHALATGGRAKALTGGVALRPAFHDGVAACVIVDQVGALIRCEADEIEPLPRAAARLRPYFSGVWRDSLASEYLFCVRPHVELPVQSHSWRRLVRSAALAPPSMTTSGGEARR